METIGRYKILETLGQGGMGTVYKAHDPLIDRIVAVKTITAQLDPDPDLRVRFMREARAAGQLSHKNIITIHDLGEENGQIFLAMEFLEGEDLSAKLLRGPRMRFERKLEVISDLCEGLAHAHSKGVVHRDLKPANVFVTTTGHVKILDFGLARMLTADLTHSQTTIGTPNYMSPEQVRGERVDHRSDIFSLGVVFYELMTSKRPFAGDSFASVIYKILQIEPEPVSVIDPTVPPEITAIVHRALAKDVGERYQQVSDIQLDLKLFQQALRSGQISIPEGSADSDLAVTGEWPADPLTSRSDLDRRGTPTPVRRAQTPTVGRPATIVSAGPTVPPRALSPGPSAWRTRGIPVVAALVIGAAGAWYVVDRNRRVAEPSAAATPPAATVTSPASPSSAPDSLAKNLADASSALERREFDEATRLARQVLEQQPANADALGILERAKAGTSAVDDKTAEAKSLGETARRTATDALGQMREAKARAEAARAQALAPRAYAAARDVEQQALGLYRSGRFGDAMGRLHETSGLYRSAEIQAHTEQMTRDGAAAAQRNAERVKAQELDAARARYDAARGEAERSGAQARAAASMQQAVARAADGEAKRSRGDLDGARADFEAATILLQQARVFAMANPPSETVTPPSPPVRRADPPAASVPLPPASPTIEESRAPILAAIERYRTALEAKNIAAMKAVWTTMSSAEEQALRGEFRNARSLSVTIEEPAVQMAGESATVRCRRGYEIVTVEGQRLQTVTRTTIKLRRSSGAWTIEGVQHEPIQ